MDLSQLLSVLDRGALFFPSVATLSENDPYEGEPTLGKLSAAQDACALQTLQLQSALFKHLNFFNCWHMNDGESDAMWKIYVRGTEGVAIQSTVARLIASFENTLDTVYMGAVAYVDHKSFEAPPNGPFSFSDYMFKRLAFQHEKEIRVGTFRSDVRQEYFNDLGHIKDGLENVTVENILLSPRRKGIYVDVRVPTLIEKVVVSPRSPMWFSNLVVSLLNKLGHTFEVVPSEMSGPSPLSSAPERT